MLESVNQERAVRQFGECVIKGQTLNALLGDFAIAAIAESTHVVGHFPGCIFDLADVDPLWVYLSIFPLIPKFAPPRLSNRSRASWSPTQSAGF